MLFSSTESIVGRRLVVVSKEEFLNFFCAFIPLAYVFMEVYVGLVFSVHTKHCDWLVIWGCVWGWNSMHSGVQTGVIFFAPLPLYMTCAPHSPRESFWYENFLMQMSCIKHGAFTICVKKKKLARMEFWKF